MGRCYTPKKLVVRYRTKWIRVPNGRGGYRLVPVRIPYLA